MSRARRDLTPTSYAVLGLLSLEPSSAYDLVRRAKMELRHFFPRAERKLYEEPKRLESLGLVVGREERTGKRLRTVYRITREGKRALRDWFALPAAGPQFESEAVLKASLGDLTTKSRLLEALRQAEDHARQGVAEGRAIAERLLNSEGAEAGLQTGRLHVVAVMYEFVFSYFETMARWASWAQEEVATWPDTSRSDDLARTMGVFRQALERSERILGHSGERDRARSRRKPEGRRRHSGS